MNISNLIQLGILLAVMISGLWSVYVALSNQIEDAEKRREEDIKNVYRRMDENKQGYYRDFVLDKVYKESHKNLVENVDQKFVSQLKIFETHLSYQTTEIKNLQDDIKDLSSRINGKNKE